MKTTVKVIRYGFWLIGMLLVCIPTIAQSWRSQQAAYGQPYSQPSATMPSATFHSTGSMKPVSTYSATSTLNANGTVNAEAYGIGRTSVSGPRRAGGGGGSGGSVDHAAEDDNRWNGSPIGDALIPLLPFALAFAAYKIIRNKNTRLV